MGRSTFVNTAPVSLQRRLVGFRQGNSRLSGYKQGTCDRVRLVEGSKGTTSMIRRTSCFVVKLVRARVLTASFPRDRVVQFVFVAALFFSLPSFFFVVVLLCFVVFCLVLLLPVDVVFVLFLIINYSRTFVLSPSPLRLGCSALARVSRCFLYLGDGTWHVKISTTTGRG